MGRWRGPGNALIGVGRSARLGGANGPRATADATWNGYSVPSLARPPTGATRWAVKESQSHGPTPLYLQEDPVRVGSNRLQQ